jgi:hypothetical protein
MIAMEGFVVGGTLLVVGTIVWAFLPESFRKRLEVSSSRALNSDESSSPLLEGEVSTIEAARKEDLPVWVSGVESSSGDRGPYRTVLDADKLDKLLTMTDEEKLRLLEIAMHCDEKCDSEQVKALARSISFEFLFRKSRIAVSPDAVVRYAFVQRSNSEDIAKLESIILGDAVKDRLRASSLMSVIGGPRVQFALERLVQADDPIVRASARYLLVKQVGIPVAFEKLEPIIVHATDEDIRQETIKYVATLDGGPDALARIMMTRFG